MMGVNLTIMILSPWSTDSPFRWIRHIYNQKKRRRKIHDWSQL